MLSGKSRAGLLLATVFAINWAETWSEDWIQGSFFTNSNIGIRCAAAFQWLEGRMSFDFNNATSSLEAYGFSAAYFLIFPILAIGITVVLAKQSDCLYLRFFARAIALNYLLSVPFYLFYPIPERWAFPESGAMLLSDRVSSRLIETFRPISGLDNSFPSAHVSITVIIILTAYLFHMRYRHVIMTLGLTVILSTYVLGIHWIPDMIAGAALGIVSTCLIAAIEIGAA
jgi:membrane-associated phospholipid phosphatase